MHIINRPITFNGAAAAALSTYGTLATGKIAYPLRDFRTVSEPCLLLVHHRDGVERHSVDLMWRGLFDHGWPSLQGFLQKESSFTVASESLLDDEESPTSLSAAILSPS